MIVLILLVHFKCTLGLRKNQGYHSLMNVFKFQVMCQHLLSLTHDIHGRPLPKKPKEIAKEAQNLGIRLVQENVLRHYEVLSLDLLGNALSSLNDFGAMYRDG